MCEEAEAEADGEANGGNGSGAAFGAGADGAVGAAARAGIVEMGYSTSCMGLFATIEYGSGGRFGCYAKGGELGNELYSYSLDARTDKEIQQESKDRAATETEEVKSLTKQEQQSYSGITEVGDSTSWTAISASCKFELNQTG